jgi:hypothetical protein
MQGVRVRRFRERFDSKQCGLHKNSIKFSCRLSSFEKVVYNDFILDKNLYHNIVLRGFVKF